MTSPEMIENFDGGDAPAETFSAPVVPHLAGKPIKLDNTTVLIIAGLVIVLGFGIWAYLDYGRAKTAHAKSHENESAS